MTRVYTDHRLTSHKQNKLAACGASTAATRDCRCDGLESGAYRHCEGCQCEQIFTSHDRHEAFGMPVALVLQQYVTRCDVGN